MVDHIIKLETAFKKPLAEAGQALKNAGIESTADLGGESMANAGKGE